LDWDDGPVVRRLVLVLSMVVCAGLPGPAVAGAVEPPPELRVTAGERSATAFQVGYCRPTGDGMFGCVTAALAAGFQFPALAAKPQSRVVVDTGLAASAVEVTFAPPDGGNEETVEGSVAVTRIDDRRWAFAMGSATVRASLGVEYADGGSSDSLLTLRRIVAESPGAGSLAAYRDVVAWSERAEDGYHLTALVDGRTARLPVAPRSVPFDVDLGPSAEGRSVAVYSRCEAEATAEGPGLTQPHTSGRGCDLYRFDFDTARESKVAGASTREASEVLPSIWRDQIAFARVYEQRPGARGRVPYLYVRPLEGPRSERQPGGARGADGLPGPTSVDLYGRRLSFAWTYATGDQAGVTELRLDTLGGGHRVLSSARYPGPGGEETSASFLSPQGVAGRILYAYQRVRLGGEAVAVPEPGGGHTDAVRFAADPAAALALRYRIATGDKDARTLPGRTAGLAVAGSEALFLAERDDLLARERATTTIVDARDLR